MILFFALLGLFSAAWMYFKRVPEEGDMDNNEVKAEKEATVGSAMSDLVRVTSMIEESLGIGCGLEVKEMAATESATVGAIINGMLSIHGRLNEVAQHVARLQ